jgi:hypothetical protein
LLRGRDLAKEAKVVIFTMMPRTDKEGEHPASTYTISELHLPAVLVVFVVWCTHENRVKMHAQHKHIPSNSWRKEKKHILFPWMIEKNHTCMGGWCKSACTHT